MNNNINILLPIAGNGKRFFEEGFKLPKPLINISGENKTILEKSLDSINVDNSKIILILRKDHVEKYNLADLIKQKIKQNLEIIISDTETEGAVSSCLMAEKFINNDTPLIIFTPDCYFEPKFNYLEIDQKYDGAVGTFYSESPAHSYVIADESNILLNAAEKEVISNNAVGGIYYYKKGKDFVECANEMIKDKNKTKNEYYICPVFNYMIKKQKKITVQQQKIHHILGTPQDLIKYEKTLRGE